MADLAVKMRGLRLARSRSSPRAASAWPSSSGRRRRPYRAWATHPEHVLVKELGRLRGLSSSGLRGRARNRRSCGAPRRVRGRAAPP